MRSVVGTHFTVPHARRCHSLLFVVTSDAWWQVIISSARVGPVFFCLQHWVLWEDF